MTETTKPTVQEMIEWLDCEAEYQKGHNRPHAAAELLEIAKYLERTEGRHD